MSDRPLSDEQLENALNGLPLREPSDMLDHRVQTALSRRAFPWRRLLTAACFGGACFWFGFAAGNHDASAPVGPAQPETEATRQARPPSAPPDTVYGSQYTRIDAQWPVAQAQLIYDIDDGPPVRATIQDTIERTRWVDPENNRDIELTIPVREVRYSRDTPY